MPNDSPSTQAARLLFLHAQTGLHPGSGTALGTVDLPVQRERHTQFPTIPGSALKGVLRDRCRERAKKNHGNDRQKANNDDADLTAAFGPGKADSASEHAGALAITDARLVAFPVRSLRGVFAWVTCPQVLLRLHRDLQLSDFGARLDNMLQDNELRDGETEFILCAEDSLRVNRTKVVLEEFEFTVNGRCDEIATWFANHATTDGPTKARLRTHLAVIGDDAFSHYARHATEIVARVGLCYATKTVKEGALFYQELLPAESLFYSVVLANPSRKADVARTATQMLDYLRDQLGPDAVIQIGGDETVGKGICFAHLTDGKESPK